MIWGFAGAHQMELTKQVNVVRQPSGFRTLASTLAIMENYLLVGEASCLRNPS